MNSGLGTEWADDAEWLATMQECGTTFRAVWAEHWEGDVMDGFGMDEPMIFDPSQGGPVTAPGLAEGDARIEEMYHLFCSGSYEQAGVLQNDLSAAEYFARNGNETALDTLQSQIDGSWDGTAKTEFTTHLGLMEQACLNMSEISDTARELVNSYQEVIITFRSRIANLVNETQAQLDLAATIERQRDLLFWDTLNNLVGALGGATDMPGGGGMTFNMVGAAAAVASVVQSHILQDQILRLNGDNETQIMVSMLGSGDQIIADARNATSAIAAGMRTLGMYVTDVRNGDNVVMPFEETRPSRPELVTDGRFDPAEFRPEDAPDGVVDDVRRDDLVAEPDEDKDEDFWAGNLPPDYEPLPIDPLGILPPPQPPTRDPYPEQ
jgi:hypothetical protein